MRGEDEEGDHYGGDGGEAETKDEEKGQGREQEDLGADLKVKGRRKQGDGLKSDVDQRRAGQLSLSNQASGRGE